MVQNLLIQDVLVQNVNPMIFMKEKKVLTGKQKKEIPLMQEKKEVLAEKKQQKKEMNLVGEAERDMPPRERRFEELSEAFIMQFRRNAAEQIGVEVSALRPEIVNFCELITRRINEAEPADFDAALDSFECIRS